MTVSLPGCRTATISLLMSSVATVALAQTPAPLRDPNMPDPKTTIPEKIRPQDPETTGSVTGPGESLSEKLERHDGVLRPPGNVDPGIQAPAPVPDPGTTRIIPPPGSPGGNPTIQPK